MSGFVTISGRKNPLPRQESPHAGDSSSGTNAPIKLYRSGGSLWLLYAICIPIFFYASLFISSQYIYGDQVYYRNLYDDLASAAFHEISILQLRHTGSSEPIYGIVMWAGAQLGVNKDIYVSIFNTALLTLSLKYCHRNNASPVFLALLLFSYYAIVLLTTAERLKFSYIIFLLSLTSTSRLGTIAWLIVSPLAHFQSLVVIGARSVGFLANITISRFVRLKSILIFIALITSLPILASIFIARFSESLQGKVDGYSNSAGGASEAYSIALLIAVALAVLPRKLEAFLMLGACAAAAAALGADRVNMIGVSLFVYLVVRDKRTKHPAVIAVMLYFSIKSIDFLQRILTTGTGY